MVDGASGLNIKEEKLKSDQQIHEARLKNIQNVCKNKDLMKNKMYKGLTKTVLYRSQHYDFTYCKVPKSGSTFWTKAFAVLKYGLEYGAQVFKQSRRQVHVNMLKYVTTMTRTIYEKSRTIIVSRDPYSRLFSAYIDKSFLNLMFTVNYQVRNIPLRRMFDTSVCPTDVTFQEFLEICGIKKRI